ncbi:MAG: hypothetical protein QOD93_1987 [Acetobacteraceae bacterium]|jgi:hypothetical protein|nr:hypothetical protein [Rhodopila sp.]MEA2727502.1 hypothetical protein [Acetobacteraceae bacterium]MEA2769025.1 hypothetical protein [Acetobacteraceae bacterium]
MVARNQRPPRIEVGESRLPNGSIGVDAGASVTLLGQMNGGTLGATLGQFLVSNGTLNGLTLLSTADLEVIGSALAPSFSAPQTDGHSGILVKFV